MGYENEIVGEIYYGDVIGVKQDVIEKIVDMINLVQWHCSSSRRGDLSVDFYTQETEWMHYCEVYIDKSTKSIDLETTRKDYYRATETFLYFIAPYLNKSVIFEVSMQGDNENDYKELKITDGKVFTNGELFTTKNTLSFPFPNVSL